MVVEVQNPRFVLFVCGHNAGRSQIGQAFFNQLKVEFPQVAQNYEAISVGTRPGSSINPFVVEAMSKVGIDISDPKVYFPKGMDDALIINNSGRIERIIIACDDTCEFPPDINATVERWSLPDPHGQPSEKVQEVRDLTKEKVVVLLQDLNRS